MTNKTILITGGNGDIGSATALKLAQKGDQVTIVGRNAEKGHAAQQLIAEATGATVSFVAVDMSVMSEVQRFANDYLTTHPKLDYLVHCAGVLMEKPIITGEGLELMFATQYLARYLLTNLLLPILSDGAKVILVSGGNVTDGSVDYDSLNNPEKFSMMSAVSKTAEAQSLYTLILMSGHPELTIYNYGPGIVKSAIMRNMSGVRGFMMGLASQFIAGTPEQAAADIAELLAGDYESGWYKKGLKYQPYNGETFAAEQAELKQFSDNLLFATQPMT